MKKQIVISLVGALLVSGCTFGSSTASGTTQATSTTTASGTPYTLADVQLHNTASDCWMAIDGSVYDVTSFISQHPSPLITTGCGKDASAAFAAERKHNGGRAQAELTRLKIGQLK
ncbi:cytochrome b5 domain-containing protein [Candidatus Woesebacteria bacterium]|nr:cytochrome b5 domain-containing protein [Candidatus Woesebacteria bacterium]